MPHKEHVRDKDHKKKPHKDNEKKPHKSHEKEKLPKGHSKSKERERTIGGDRSNHSEKEKGQLQIKEEKANSQIQTKESLSDVRGNFGKRMLVDLDLFQDAQIEEKKPKVKSKEKNPGKEGKRGNDRKHLEKEESRNIKRERDDDMESDDEPNKRKPNPGSGDVSLEIKQEYEGDSKKGKVAAARKRKSKEEEGETKTKRSKVERGQTKTNRNKDKGGEVKTKKEEEGETKTKKSKEEKQKEEDAAKWKWWEEANHEDGVKWKFLEHRGPYFAPPYEPLPEDVRFLYDGEAMKLSLAAEEVATFYGKMLDHDYTTKEAFQNNFFGDWRTQMTKEEKKIIKHLEKCDFTEIHKYFFDRNEERKALPKEKKQKLKEEASKLQEEYGYCILDGHREKIGNFKIEPPGLFRGRGDHPKMGMLKLRIRPEDVIINCSKDAKIPEAPPGHKWKEVRFDNTVTWLASWTENIQNAIKYIMLNPSSKLKGEKDWQKYEMARRLKDVVEHIRSEYRADWKSREMRKRQRAVALYFIDKLALRAGNEKEEGETADTVGCCSLRVEHIQLFSELDGQKYVVEFDFLGKDSIRYYNKVPVEKEVFKNLKRFKENKDPEDDLFDRLNTSTLNKHLQDLMDGLTAKVFRTYNASITLQNQLKALTNAEDNVAAKILSYNRANRAVALLCNHQRALPKTFEKSMQNLQAKIDAKEAQLKEAKKELKRAKADHKKLKNDKTKKELEKKKKQVERLEEQLQKLKLMATDKEENKQIALGTSKLNYLDPRITAAWCKKFGVPIEKIYNKTQRDKFAWAIAMTNEDFEF
ncbi:DNA topoisomerase I, mitochondrial [Mantella aurantiaca]